MGQPHVLIAVANLYDVASEQSVLSVNFYVASGGVKGNLIARVPKGVFTATGVLDIARDQLRMFAGSLADATAPLALTHGQIQRLRRDYQPDPLRR